MKDPRARDAVEGRQHRNQRSPELLALAVAPDQRQRTKRVQPEPRAHQSHRHSPRCPAPPVGSHAARRLTVHRIQRSEGLGGALHAVFRPLLQQRADQHLEAAGNVKPSHKSR